MQIIPKGGFDPTKVSFTPKWFLALVLAVIVVSAGLAVGAWGYSKVKDMIPAKIDAEGAW